MCFLLLVVVFMMVSVLHCHLWEIQVALNGSLKARQPQEQRYPFLSVCAVFSCVRTVVWLPMFGIFKVRTDVDVCDCTQGLCGHRKRVCTESWLGEKSLAISGSRTRASFCTWLFSQMLNHLSYPCTCMCFIERLIQFVFYIQIYFSYIVVSACEVASRAEVDLGERKSSNNFR